MGKLAEEENNNKKEYRASMGNQSKSETITKGNPEFHGNEEGKQQQNEINNYLKQLTEQITSTNKNSADLEEKLSNFLSTQLNTQASILQIISKINEKGILDDSTKKIFVNLNKGIQELIAKNKK